MKKLKQNRAVSYLLLVLIYTLAAFVGIVTYRALTLDWWAALFIADAAATLLVFAFSLILKNASVYDPYWSVQPPVILLAFGLGGELTVLGTLILINFCTQLGVA